MNLFELAQIAQSASIILATLFGIYGFDAWRREHIGIRRIGLAEDILSLFYQARDAISDIRSPFGFSGEGSSREPAPGEMEEHREALDSAYILIERYKKHSELFSKIGALRYRAMAQFGSDSEAPFQQLNEIQNKLFVAAHRMARLRTTSDWPHASQEQKQRTAREIDDVYSIYYGTGGEDDPISKLMNKAVSEAEEICRRIIDNKGTLFALFNLKVGCSKRRLQ
ncbi:hypothetical protein [Denitromonas sp.]|uniref:hypothetical protein n=1 Tax=Denitromonas sp. TaxID=2734609 RepID=UPI003A891F95